MQFSFFVLTAVGVWVSYVWHFFSIQNTVHGSLVSSQSYMIWPNEADSHQLANLTHIKVVFLSPSLPFTFNDS